MTKSLHTHDKLSDTIKPAKFSKERLRKYEKPKQIPTFSPPLASGHQKGREDANDADGSSAIELLIRFLRSLRISLLLSFLIRLLIRLSPLEVSRLHPISLWSDDLLRSAREVHVKLPHDTLIPLMALLLGHMSQILRLRLHAK